MANPFDNIEGVGAVAVEEAPPEDITAPAVETPDNPFNEVQPLPELPFPELAKSLRFGDPRINMKPVQPTMPQYLRYKLTMDRAGSDRSRFGAAAMWGRMDTQVALKEGNRVRDHWIEQAGPYQDLSFKQAPLKFIAGETVQLLPYMINSQIEGAKYGLITAMGFGGITAVAGQVGPQVAFPEELLTVPVAAAVGFKVGWTYGVIKNVIDREGGGLYFDMIEKGISEKTARPLAIAGSAVIGITEVAQFRTLSKPLKQAWAKVLRTSGGQKAIRGALLRYFKTVGIEVAQEEIQEITSLTTETIAGMIDDKPDAKPTKEEWKTRLLETAKKAGTGLAVISIPGGVIDVVTSVKASKGVTNKADVAAIDNILAEEKGEQVGGAAEADVIPEFKEGEITIEGERFVEEVDPETGERVFKPAPAIEITPEAVALTEEQVADLPKSDIAEVDAVIAEVAAIPGVDFQLLKNTLDSDILGNIGALADAGVSQEDIDNALNKLENVKTAIKNNDILSKNKELGIPEIYNFRAPTAGAEVEADVSVKSAQDFIAENPEATAEEFINAQREAISPELTIEGSPGDYKVIDDRTGRVLYTVAQEKDAIRLAEQYTTDITNVYDDKAVIDQLTDIFNQAKGEEVAPEAEVEVSQESIKPVVESRDADKLNEFIDKNLQAEIDRIEASEDKRLSLKEKAALEIKNIEATIKAVEESPQFNQFGIDIFEGKKDVLKDLRAQVKHQKEKLKDLRPTKITKQETTLLKEKLADIERGFKIGKTLTTKDIKVAQDKIISIVEKSGLNPEKQKQFQRSIKNINKQNFEKKFPVIKERIEKLLGQQKFSTAKDLLKKALKQTKTKKQAGKRVGKFTAETQAALDTIRKIVEMPEGQAEQEILKNLDNLVGFVPDEELQLQNTMLTLFSGFDRKSAADLQKAVNVIADLKKSGKEAREFLKTEERAELERQRQLVISQVTGGKGLKPGRQTAGARKSLKERMTGVFKGLGSKYIFSLNGMLETLEFNTSVLDKKLVKEFGVLQQENKYKELESEFIGDLNLALSESYNIKPKTQSLKDKMTNALAIQRQLNKLTKEIPLGTFTNSKGQQVELIFTKDEMIKKYMELQDPTLFKSFIEGNNYTFPIMRAIYSHVDQQDRAFARAQMALYKKQWKRINPLYRKFYGVNLPFNEFYSPIARENFKEDLSKPFGQLSEDFGHRIAVTSGSLKQRVNSILPLKTMGSVAVLDRHFRETNYLIAWAEKMREFERVFKDVEVKAAIDQVFSPNVYKALSNQINDIATNGNRNARQYPVVDFFRKGFTIGRLSLKPALTAKQFVSTVAYLEKVNPISFLKGSISFWKNPIKNYNILKKESTFIKERGGSNMERDISAATKSDVFKQFSLLQNYKNLALLNIQIGDKGAIVWGSWIMRQDRVAKNIPLSEIINEYEEFGSDTQQSADLSRLSEAQRGGSLDKLFTMFKSSQRQYLAKEVNAIKSLFQKDGLSAENVKKVARVIVIYHVLLPTMFQFIANFGGWDDEDRKEYLRAGLLGSINGLFIFGDVIDGIVRTMLGLRSWPNEVPVATIGKSLESAIRQVDLEDITIEDLGAAMAELSEAGDSLGVPISYMKGISQGANNILEGDIHDGIGELLGWSEYVIEGGKDKRLEKL